MVCLSVCLSVGCHDREPCKAAESIEILFGMWNRVGRRKEPCIRWGPDPPMRMGDFEGEGAAHCKV